MPQHLVEEKGRLDEEGGSHRSCTLSRAGRRRPVFSHAAPFPPLTMCRPLVNTVEPLAGTMHVMAMVRRGVLFKAPIPTRARGACHGGLGELGLPFSDLLPRRLEADKGTP